MGRKSSQAQLIVRANEKRLLSQQAQGRFPLCLRPTSKEIVRGASAKCELKYSQLLPTDRLCPECIKYSRAMVSTGSARARRSKKQSVQVTQEEVIIADTVEAIQDEKNSLLAENEGLSLEIQKLHEKIQQLELPNTSPHQTVGNDNVRSERNTIPITIGVNVREFSMKLLKEKENLKQELTRSQATTQHHLITINQLNTRVSFLQDQVSTLTFYYTQESHAHRATKLQLQNISHHPQQQLQPQQHQQQPAVLQQHQDPLKLQ